MRPSRQSRIAAAVGASILTLGLVAGCGGDDEPGNGHGMGPMHGSSAEGSRDGTGSEGTVSERHNDADVEFAQDMIPHHEQALLMIKMVERHGASPELESMVTTMAMTQSSEIGYM
ncbi:MAG: DUF305 domain-containing protein, partial [Nocardioidaceae bacterium]